MRDHARGVLASALCLTLGSTAAAAPPTSWQRLRPPLPAAVPPPPLDPFCSGDEKTAFAQDLAVRRREAQGAADAAAAHHRWLLHEAERRRDEPLSGPALAVEAAAYAEVRRTYQDLLPALAARAAEAKRAPVLRCALAPGEERCGGRPEPAVSLASCDHPPRR